MSIKKIAELANTSPATVSRVLNDPEHICHDPELAKRYGKLQADLIICLTQLLVNFAKENLN